MISGRPFFHDANRDGAEANEYTFEKYTAQTSGRWLITTATFFVCLSDPPRAGLADQHPALRLVAAALTIAII
ncbi:MAG: hypothetical protein IH914_03830 [candidate division Zixibacteria bacterium]|nr:hypothetical protein [candidate division Zixibacteria bacterium]